MRTIIEPFRIKTVEPIRMTTRDERERLIAAASYNLFGLKSDDVIIDLRRGSPTRARWEAVELSAENRRLLYIPAGFAHGFQTQEDATEVAYQMSATYHAESARGVRWNDPAFGIRWPLAVTEISARDRGHPDFVP